MEDDVIQNRSRSISDPHLSDINFDEGNGWTTLHLKLSELYLPLDFDLDLRKYRFLHLLAIHRKPNTVASSRWQARVRVHPGVLHESRPDHIFDEILK